MIAKVCEHERIVRQYVDDVLSCAPGWICGKLEKAACQRFLDDERDAESRGWYFDRNAAVSAINLFERNLRHTQGTHAGKPFILYPLQKFVVWNVFGWKLKETQLRRFQQVFYSVARGNGKTPLGAGMVLKAGPFDVLPGGQRLKRASSYCTATKRDQARIAFDDLKAYLDYTDENGRPLPIRKTCEIFQNKILFHETGSTIECISSDGKTTDGFRIQAILRDEVHAYTEQHREFREKIDTALQKFEQPLDIIITTAGNENSKQWKEWYNLARCTVERDNAIDIDALFVMICEIDDGDWDEARDNGVVFDFDNLHKANPLLKYGIVKERKLRTELETALINPASKISFLRYYCNKEVSALAKIFNRVWGNGAGELPQVDHRKVTPFSAIDLGWKDDLAALSHVWALEDGRYVVEWDVFIPRMGPRNLAREPWASWIRDGYLTVTDSEWTDTQAIYKVLAERQQRHGIVCLAYDPSNATEFALNTVNDLGIDAFAFTQKHAKYNEPIDKVCALLSEGRLKHGDNPIAAWCASNMITSTNPAGHKMPDKQVSDDKIDLMCAMLMALSGCMFAEQPERSSFADPEYDKVIIEDAETKLNSVFELSEYELEVARLLDG